MKKLLTTLLLVICLSSYAQQGNLCQLLIKSFNTSEEGFPLLRPGTKADAIKDYSINEDTINNYGLKRGNILKYSNLKSKLYNGKTFTAWTLLLAGQSRFLQDKSWDEVKETVTKQFSDFAKQYAEGCFPQLQMSELILPVEKYDDQLLTFYFYLKQISVPEGADKTQIENLLAESTYIIFSVRETAFVKGYYMSYSVKGLKYND